MLFHILYSCWTNWTGISTIGSRTRRCLLLDGQTLLSSRSSRSMPGMKAKLSDVCLTSRNRLEGERAPIPVKWYLMTSIPFLNVYLYIRLVSLNVTKICSNSITRRHVYWIDMDYNHSFSSFSQVHNRCQKSPMCSHGHLWNSSPQERPHTK